MKETSKPYKSIEQRLFVDSGINDFLAYTGKSSYGVVASMFRLPTAIRKIINRQTFIEREKIRSEEPNNAKSQGVIAGGIIATLGSCVYMSWSLYEATKNNYLPLLILGATNALSMTYEIGRLSRSKQERLEIEAEEEARGQTQVEEILKK